jgi:hypothetical protein
MAYYRSLMSRAWTNTTLLSADKSLAVGYAVLRSIVEHRTIGWKAMLSQTPQFIFNAIAAYLVLCLLQFGWQIFRAVGDDQEAKRIALYDLNALSSPPLSRKSQRLLDRVQGRIDAAEPIFNHFNNDEYAGWNIHTQALLLRWLTSGSPWFSGFCDAEHVDRIARQEAPLLNQIAVLYRLIDEVRRGRVFVRDSILSDQDDGLGGLR